MLKWLLTLLLAVIVLGLIVPHLSRGDRTLPGDVAFRFRGRIYRFPFASTLVFSLALTAFAVILNRLI